MNISAAFYYLISTIFTIFIILVWSRFALQWVRADFYNPVCQLIIKTTNFAVKPLRKIIPGLYGLDLATLCLFALAQLIKLMLLTFIATFYFPAVFGLFIWFFADSLQVLIYFYFFVIILLAINSWFNPGQYSIYSALLSQLANPLLKPFRKYIPAVSGIDITPLIFIIVLQFFNILLISPFCRYAMLKSFHLI